MLLSNSIGYEACAGVGDKNAENSGVKIGNCSCNYMAQNEEDSACYRLGEYKRTTSVGDMSWYVETVV